MLESAGEMSDGADGVRKNAVEWSMKQLLSLKGVFCEWKR